MYDYELLFVRNGALFRIYYSCDVDPNSEQMVNGQRVDRIFEYFQTFETFRTP